MAGNSERTDRWHRIVRSPGLARLRRLSGVVAITAATSIGVAAGLAACTEAPPEVSADDPELISGRDIYARNCASCHGSDGGGGVGRKLNEGAVVAAYPDIADQIELISNGRGTMPAYMARLTEDEIRAVSRYTREVLS
jgi:mono/diheme cytochrome c family protein